MNLQHVNVKVYVEGELSVDPKRFIEVFHRWIREATVEGLLIDVADYRHVPSGPGVMLIGHEADYSLDNTAGCWALLYNRKAPLEGSNPARFHDALKCAANACRLLETELADDGPLKFSRTTFDVIINDRALAPNTAETFAAAQPELEAFLTSALGHDAFRLEHNADPRCRFSVTVTTEQPFDFAAVLADH